jgi:hypothetical protein
MHHLGRRLVELITDMSLEEHPIFFHVFSNGGAFLYQHVSQTMQMCSKPLKVQKEVVCLLTQLHLSPKTQ